MNDDQMLCSTVSRHLGEEPIGTVKPHERFIMLELELPWSKPLLETKHFPLAVKERIERLTESGVKFRFLTFHADKHRSPQGMHRLFCFTRPKGLAAEFEKQEFIVPEALLPDLIQELTSSGDPVSAEYATYEVKSNHVRELFICTHGRHDACCGKRGTPIYQSISKQYAPRLNGKLRAWQVSHVGGHRLSPTLMDFPSGRYWGMIEEKHLETLMHPEQMMPKLAQQYRGWSGVGLLEQVAEREVWIKEGPRWLSYLKNASIVDKTEHNETIVRVDYQSIDGTVAGAYEVKVVKTGELTLSGCGALEPTIQAQYEVKEIRPIEFVS